MLSEHLEQVSFIHYGAHQSNQSDDVYSAVKHDGWRGIVIEPEAQNFELLKQDYSGIDGIPPLPQHLHRGLSCQGMHRRDRSSLNP